ncbi:hypothetical protein SUGI_1205120 [Cryptomeria japonica]|nr:hypothetical protein SUGI_1205120 [Cryptomeria japonica]
MVSDSKGSSKFSFSLPTKSSGKPKVKPSEDKEFHEEEDRPEFVNEFDPAKPIKKVKVVPKLENSWRPEKRMKNIQMKDSELQFEPEADLKDSHDSNVEFGLNLRTHVAVPMEVDKNGEEGFKGIDENEKINNSGVLGFMNSGEEERKRLRESIDELPEEASLEAYSSLPVEDFGAALLRGMGWSEEKGIGRAKEPVMPIEYVRRVGREGLGATPAPSLEKSKKFVKPGESREGRRRDLVAAPGPDGRIRNVVNVGEKLVERHRKGVAVGKIMFIAEGRHVGLRGEVTEVLGEGSGDKRVVMRLCKSEEKVVVGVGDVADVGSVEEVDCLRRLKEVRVDGRGTSRDGRAQKGYKDEENGSVRSRDRDGVRDSGSRDEKHDRREEDYGSRDEKKMDEMGRGECERDNRFRDERRESRSREQGKSVNDDSRDEKRHDNRREDWDRPSRQSDVYRDRGHQGEKGNWKGDGRRDEYRDRKEDARREDYRDRKEDPMQDKYHNRKENSRRQNYNDREEVKNRKGEEERSESRDMRNRNDGTANMKEKQTNEDRRKTEFESKANEKSRSENGIQESVLPISWLTSQIRVRVISKDFQGGKLYLKKGRVIDVVDPTTCDLLMDENGVVVQGVKQDDLETALPKRGGLVMVVEGKQRGVVGKLLERDSDKGVGLVRKEDTYETLTLSLDHIAEFLGEPEELGY